jgi:hypothetical protein
VGDAGDHGVSAPAAATPSLGGRAVLALLVRPDLWWTAVRVALRLAPAGWWRRPPFLPLPSPQYLRFRMVTAYGGDGSSPARPADLVAYLEWCRAWPAVTHRS